MPEAHWDAQAGKVKDTFGQHLSDLTAFKAAEDVRRNALPQKPEDYKYELPKDFQAPQGLEFKFNESDPNLQAARAVAKELGISQDGFSKLLGLYAGTKVNETQAIKGAYDAEVAKLGSAGPARVSAVTQFLNGILGEDGARPLVGTKDRPGVLWTADIVKSFETLITKLASGHGSTFSHAHRDGGKTEVDDATYNSWSHAERMNYARTGDPNKAAA